MRCFGSDLPVKVFCGLVAHTVCRCCYTVAGRVCPLCKYLLSGICKTNPPSNTSFEGTAPPPKSEETPKKDKGQAARMATREAEGASKREKKFKYDRAKGYPTKTPLEDGYKVSLYFSHTWNPPKIYCNNMD